MTQNILGKYRHYKGKEYEVIGMAKHSETLEEYVIYRACYGNKETWIRPQDMFFEIIFDAEGKKHPRFEKIES
jgi:hypothetical protein